MLLFILLITVSVINLILVVRLLERAKRNQPGWRFACFILCTTGWTICMAVLEVTRHLLVATVALRAAHVFAIATLVCWVWFCTVFPFPSRKFRSYALAISVLSVPWLVLCWTPWLVRAIRISAWGIDPQFGPLLAPYTLLAVCAAIGGVVHLIVKVQRARGNQRMQVYYVLLGAVLLFIMTLIPNLLLPVLGYSCRLAPYSPIASILLTSVTSYAILRYRLLDIRIVLRAGLIYAITIGVTAVLFAGLVVVLDGITAHFQYPLGVSSFAVATILALIFQPIRHQVGLLLDRFFFRAVYDYRETLRASSEALASVRETPILVDILTGAILRALRPTGIAVYLPNASGALTRIITSGSWQTLPTGLPDSIHAFVTRRDAVFLTHELRGEPAPAVDIADRLESWGVVVALPLVAGKQLCGLVLVGEKLSCDIYSRDDLGMLSILSKQAAIALDNAYHYETLRRINTQLEQRVCERTSELAAANAKLGETNIALEAERAYLSAAIDILPLPMFFLSQDGSVPIRNNACEVLAGATDPAVLLTNHLLDRITHAPIPAETNPGSRALHGEVITASEVLLALPDDREVPILVHAGPIYVGEDCVAAVVAFQDISALKAADKAKDEFLAVLSHELKTPLTCILAWTEVAQYETDPIIAKKSIDIIRQNAIRQRHLLDDLLDVSRIIHHKLLLTPVPADFWELVTQCTDDFEYIALDRQISITLHPPDEPLPIRADTSRMCQVIVNLLSNALKFTEPGGAIQISGRRCGTQAVLEIADTGRGIPPDILPALFAPFRQVERVEPSGGLGLGLALVKGISELHHGHVRAASAGLGQGSVFTVVLPLDYPCRMPNKRSWPVSRSWGDPTPGLRESGPGGRNGTPPAFAPEVEKIIHARLVNQGLVME